MTAEKKLPPAFSDLESFIADWGLTNERDRYYKLHESALEELREFYDAMLPRLDDIIDHLNQYPLEELPADASCLFDLALTFAETAHPCELKWRGVDFNNAYPWERLEFCGVSAPAAK